MPTDQDDSSAIIVARGATAHLGIGTWRGKGTQSSLGHWHVRARHRHPAEFQAWANRVAGEYGYDVRFLPIGDEDPEVGSPTQMGVFERMKLQ